MGKEVGFELLRNLAIIRMVDLWEQAKNDLGEEKFQIAISPHMRFIQETCEEEGKGVLELVIPFSNHLHEMGHERHAVMLVVVAVEILNREFNELYYGGENGEEKGS